MACGVLPRIDKQICLFKRLIVLYRFINRC